MRHSDSSLTANVFGDPKLLEVAGALESLPSLSADSAGAFANGDQAAEAR